MPKVGEKTIDKLIDAFGTEMNILNKATKDDLEGVVGKDLAEIIDNARNGKLHIHSGGGGVYGKVER
jgi:PHP family Zn ribbon phosphoesterase